eukprot:TRINITY_DN32670_c0_g1_i1.p1 TRINITY_DN32670_c0_g1~~TRINITY_DN32670_c0_g1_i1.p1  ORF type:complete len:582 (-),score=158.63 TRINITY_DN32670_c0_g1_i1:103-1848(-)
MIRRPPRSTLSSSSAASDVYKRQGINAEYGASVGREMSRANALCCGGEDRNGLDSVDNLLLDEALNKTIEDIFAAVDSNGDQFIDADEADILAQAIFSKCGEPMNPKDFKKLLIAMDEDQPFGKINLAELKKFVSKQTNMNATYNKAFNKENVGQLLTDVQERESSHSADINSGRSAKFIDATQESDVNQNYTKVRKLGAGKYAAVELWQKKSTNDMVAVKVFNKSSRSKKEIYDVISEFLLMRKLLDSAKQRNSGRCHPNIVELYEMIETPHTMNLVLEYMPGGELYQVLTAQKTFTENVAQSIISQILLGLQYLHINHIIHSDLKPENVMVNQTRGPPYVVKIADFGLSEVIVDRTQGFHEWHGSPYYMAPELFARKTNYTEKVDLWAAGIMLHELLHGAPAIRAKSRAELDQKVRNFEGFNTENGAAANGPYAREVVRDWDNSSHKCGKVPMQARKVIAQLLRHDPAQRPSATLILKDEWFKSDASNTSHEVNDSVAFYEHRTEFTEHLQEDKWLQLRTVLGRVQMELRTQTLLKTPAPSATKNGPARAGNAHNQRVPTNVSVQENRQSNSCGDCSVM